GQDASFVCSALARQLALIEAGRQEPVLRVGNPDPVRDFSDVRDVVAGYVALLERGRAGDVYNLCSGEGVSIAEVIAILRTHARVPVRVHSDPTLRRAHDVPRLVGTHAHATNDTGWVPRTHPPVLARPISAGRSTEARVSCSVHGAPAPHPRAAPPRAGAHQCGRSPKDQAVAARPGRAPRASPARSRVHLRGGSPAVA